MCLPLVEFILGFQFSDTDCIKWINSLNIEGTSFGTTTNIKNELKTIELSFIYQRILTDFISIELWNKWRSLQLLAVNLMLKVSNPLFNPKPSLFVDTLQEIVYHTPLSMSWLPTCTLSFSSRNTPSTSWRVAMNLIWICNYTKKSMPSLKGVTTEQEAWILIIYWTRGSEYTMDTIPFALIESFVLLQCPEKLFALYGK